jgi:RNA polymerase sigma-70 factor, ECF subfamily
LPLAGARWSDLSLPAYQTSDFVAPVDAKPPEPLDVPALTRRMVQGDETAYRAFYEAYFDRMFRYLLVVTSGDEEAAREALQSALVRVVRHIKIFPNEAVFWGWLTVLARTALADQKRKRRRYLAFLERFTWHSRVEQAVPVDREADGRLESLLQESVQALPFDERQLVEAKYFERRSVREVAEETNLTEKAVESRLVRIRQRLKAAIVEGLRRE